MKIAIVGLGRRGAGLSRRLRRAGHDVVGYDQNSAVSEVGSLTEMVAALPSPRVVWLMVPAGEPTETAIKEACDLLAAGDIIIDGGNSYYKGSIRRARQVESRGMSFLDVGTSGGIWGEEIGFCLMIGGPQQAFRTVEPDAGR